MLLSRERECLRAIKAITEGGEFSKKRATRVAISRRMKVSTEYIEYLCRRLEDRGFITGHPMRGYQLTEDGEAVFEYVQARRDVWH